jgi:hypothetical protein
MRQRSAAGSSRAVLVAKISVRPDRPREAGTCLA